MTKYEIVRRLLLQLNGTVPARMSETEIKSRITKLREELAHA